MKYDFSHMGENIASLRRAAGLTQELLADRLGVTSQAVSKWERQLSCPDVSLLPAMAEVFGVGINELFAEAPPILPKPLKTSRGRMTAEYASPYSRESASAPKRYTNAPTGRRWCFSSATRTDGTPCPSGW